MTIAVSFDADASTGLSSSAAWYEEQRAGLGARFLREVERIVLLVAEQPAIGTPTPPPRDARRVLVDGFPYAVRYVVADRRLRVLTVVHQARRP